MKKKLGAIFMTLCFLFPSNVFAESSKEPTIYVIKKGDTLWGLSERFIKDPKFWPNMWAKNRQITNPHLIYPGQKIRVFDDRLEMVPAAHKSATATKNSEFSQEVTEEKSFPVLGNESFLLLENVNPSGYLVGVQHDRIAAGVDDIVFTDIGTNHGAGAGDKFSVYRAENTVTHPFTNEIGA